MGVNDRPTSIGSGPLDTALTDHLCNSGCHSYSCEHHGYIAREPAGAGLREAAEAFALHVQSLACDHGGAKGGTHTGCPERLALNATLAASPAEPGLDVERCPAAKHHRVRKLRQGQAYWVEEEGELGLAHDPEIVESDTCVACGLDYAALSEPKP